MIIDSKIADHLELRSLENNIADSHYVIRSLEKDSNHGEML